MLFIAAPLTLLQLRNNPFSFHPERDAGYQDNPGSNNRIKGTDTSAPAATEP
jgi:hypothetical protein